LSHRTNPKKWEQGDSTRAAPAGFFQPLPKRTLYVPAFPVPAVPANGDTALEWYTEPKYNQNNSCEDIVMPIIEAPLELVEAIAALRIPPKTDAHLQDLMDRNAEGQLTESEREQLESLVELSDQLAVLRAAGVRLLAIQDVPSSEEPEGAGRPLEYQWSKSRRRIRAAAKTFSEYTHADY